MVPRAVEGFKVFFAAMISIRYIGFWNGLKAWRGWLTTWCFWEDLKVPYPEVGHCRIMPAIETRISGLRLQENSDVSISFEC